MLTILEGDMTKRNRSILSVFIAFTIILVGLFLVCSQRAATTYSGEDLSADDEQFRQELLEMLDLADDLEGQDSTGADVTVVDDAGSDQDVLSMLVPEDQVTSDDGDQLSLFTPEEETTTQTSDAPAQTTDFMETDLTDTADNMGLSEDMFREIEADIERLEDILADRTGEADSLRRIIDTRNARIRQLETQLVNTPPASRGVATSTGGYTTTANGPFMSSYHQARAQFESFQYAQAVASFQSLLQQYPNHQMADNCQYWIGECYFGMRQYQQALIEFQKVFAYSQTDKHDDAQIMIGMCYVKSGDMARARQEFQTFLNTYQYSEYSGVARRYSSSV